MLTLAVDVAAAPWLRNGPLVLLVLPVALAAWYGGTGPGLTAALVAAVGANLFVMTPNDGIGLSATEIVATLTLVIVGSTIGVLTGRARRGELAAVKIAARPRVTLTSIGDGVIVTDERGHSAFINPIAASMLGRTVDSVVGQSIDDVFPLVSEITGETVENPVSRVLREGVVINLTDGTQLVHQDGTTLPIADSCAPIRDAKGVIEGAVLVFRDQTQKRQVDQWRTYQAAIVESSTDAIKGTTLDGTITTWNAAAEHLYGYPANEILGRNISITMLPHHSGELVQGY